MRHKALVIAYGVHESGRREVIGLDVGQAETEAFWREFLRSLRARGLDGVKLCISDAHQGLKNAIAQVLGCPWQRCTVHWSCKESTWWCIGVGWCCGEEVGCGAVADGCRDGRVAFLLEEGSGLADDVADGGPADVAEGLGEDVQGAQVSLVEDGEQDTLAVADLLRKHPEAGTRLAWTATTLMVEAVGLGRLPHGESLGECV